MSDYKPETLPSGVMLRKIKSEDEGFILSNIDQALIVTNLDIAAMYGLAYPEIQPALKSSLASIIKEPINAVQAWHDVSQKLTQNMAATSAAYDAEVRRIAEVLARWRYIKDFILWDTMMEEIGRQWDNCEKIESAHKELYINSKMEEARAMVAEMAKVAEAAYEHCDTEPVFHPIGIKAHLIERGLIPASAQEGGENG